MTGSGQHPCGELDWSASSATQARAGGTKGTLRLSLGNCDN